MKESINNALILNIVIIFLFVMAILFAGSTAYTKAFKVKNKIINILERNESSLVGKTQFPSEITSEIDQALSDIGYRIEKNVDQKCKNSMNKRFKNSRYDTTPIITGTNYNFCVTRFHDDSDVMQGEYYAVITYMYFEIPVLGKTLEFPVYGETKTLGLKY